MSSVKTAAEYVKERDAMIRAGAQILSDVLVPAGFHFEPRRGGIGSGGAFAHGQFVRGDRRLEIHFRDTLGLISYHLGKQQVSHQDYLKCLGVYGRHHYPDFPNDPLESFHALAKDLSLFFEDFLTGDGSLLLACAADPPKPSLP
jgi:hypothetical protein